MPSPIHFQRPDMIGRGILLTLVTVLVFGAQDAVSKILVQDHSPFMITMLRYWGFAVFSLIMVARQAPLRQAFQSKMPITQTLRGVLLIADIWVFAFALITVPLGELQAIVTIYPLLVTIFAIPILGEKVGIFRFVAVGAGLVGAMIIMRPGGVPLEFGAVCALAASAFYSLYIVLTRKVSAVDTTATSMLYAAVVGVVFSTVIGVFFLEPLNWSEILMVLFIIATTCVGHGLMAVALSMAPASVLQPFNYFSLPCAIVLGVIIFNQWIDPISLIGAAIIVAAGLVVMVREQVKAQRANKQAS